MVDDLGLPSDVQAVHAARRAAAYRRVVQTGALHAQPFSEGNQAAAGKQAFVTTARREDGGWRVNGRKIFASLSGAADYYVILATEANPTPRLATHFFSHSQRTRKAYRSSETGTHSACAAPCRGRYS